MKLFVVLIFLVILTIVTASFFGALRNRLRKLLEWMLDELWCIHSSSTKNGNTIGQDFTRRKTNSFSSVHASLKLRISFSNNPNKYWVEYTCPNVYRSSNPLDHNNSEHPYISFSVPKIVNYNSKHKMICLNLLKKMYLTLFF